MRVHESWQEIINQALNSLDKKYLEFLDKGEYFPDKNNFLNAFKTLPLEKTKFILFGQDPYPRKQSASGYAFIDTKVEKIFSENGLSKEVNKATSLRNFIKMQLKANNYLKNPTKEEIAKLNKDNLINSIIELRQNFEFYGILLLNMSLVFTDKKDSKKHIKQFKPFIQYVLKSLPKNINLILFGSIAKDVKKLLTNELDLFSCPHPYNISFIDDENVLLFFQKFRLLDKNASR